MKRIGLGFLFFIFLMTLNGLRLPCMCTRSTCNGAEKDYRTVRAHAKKDLENRPLFPAALEQDNALANPPIPVENKQEEMPPDLPYPDIPNDDHNDDLVSYVEALPNCHEPVYMTVYNINITMYSTLFA